MKHWSFFVVAFFPVFLFSQTPDASSVLAEADSLIRVCRSLSETRQLDAALQAIQTAEDNILKVFGENHPTYTKCLFNHGRAFHLSSKYPEAETWYLKARTLQASVIGKQTADYASTLNNLGNIYREMGLYDSSEVCHLQALKIREIVLGKKDKDYAGSLNNLANLYWNTGRYETAESLYLEAKSVWLELYGKNHRLYATCLHNMGSLYLELGQYELAESHLTEALNLRRELLGNKHDDYASTLNSFANLKRWLAEFEAAELMYKEALKIREEVLGRNDPLYAASLDNLAILYQETGRFEEAETLYITANKILEETMGATHPEFGRNLQALAILYREMHRFKDAEPIFHQALAIFEKSLEKDSYDYANCLNNLASLQEATGNIHDAAKSLLEAESIQKNVFGENHFFYAQILNNLTLASQITDVPIPTATLCMHANKIERNLLLNSTYHLSESELSSYAAKFTKDLDIFFSFAQAESTSGVNSEIPSGAYDNSLFYKGFLLTSTKQARKLALSNPVSKAKFEALTACHRLLAGQYAKPVRERQGVAELEEKALQLEKELVRTVAGFGEALQQVSWQDVRDNLKPGEAAVEFIQYGFYNPKLTDSIFYSALVLRPGDSAPHFMSLFEQREIASQLAKAKGGNFRGINALYSVDAEKSLYDLIWKPLENLLQGTETVYCSPTGLLHQINLAAMPVNAQQILANHYNLVLLGSTRQLVSSEKAILRLQNDAFVAGGIRYNTGTSALANPDLLASRSGSLEYLSGSATEAIEISNILKSANFVVQLDTGYAATEESFKRLSCEHLSPRIILASTHGFFFEYPKNKNPTVINASQNEPVFKLSEHPMNRSGLILAGAQQAWTTGKSPENKDDGILTAYEISQMNLSGTELVVLSACETGLGDIEGNEGVYGLQRAFKIAGVKYLVMSLWKVSDGSTRELMTLFFTKIKEGSSIPQAFRAAQDAMKRKYPKDPFQWAGFVLIE